MDAAAYVLNRVLAIATLTVGLPAQLVAAQEIVLYENDFETPNQPIAASCGNSLDQAGINACYGRPGYSFVEELSVDVVVLHDSAGKYANQGTENGRYAIGMLGKDKLALRLDLQSQQFLNVTMDVSSIDVDGCGGPFGVETPRFKLTLLDNPNGSFEWSGRKLAEATLEGEPARDDWTFEWSRATVSLAASGATHGNVVVVFDLVSQGYAVFDNLAITATRWSAIADRDGDGAADATDNCPGRANGNQANTDQDSAGDACDPAPMDPNRCGDRSGDGTDDCRDFCDMHAVASCALGRAGSSAALDDAGSSPGAGGRGAAADDAGMGEEDHDRFSARRSGGGRASAGEADASKAGEGCTSVAGRRPSTPAAAFGLFALGLWWLRRRSRAEIARDL